MFSMIVKNDMSASFKRPTKEFLSEMLSPLEIKDGIVKYQPSDAAWANVVERTKKALSTKASLRTLILTTIDYLNENKPDDYEHVAQLAEFLANKEKNETYTAAPVVERGLQKHLDVLKSAGLLTTEETTSTVQKNTNLPQKQDSQPKTSIAKILVIGGGDGFYKYDRKHFFDIGYHPTASFGAERDWTEQSYWSDFSKLLQTLKQNFKGIIVDSGSESWMSGFDLGAFFNAIRPYLLPNAFAISANALDRGGSEKWYKYLVANGFPVIAQFRLPDASVRDVYSIHGNVDTKDIKLDNLQYKDKVLGVVNSKSYIDWNKNTPPIALRKLSDVFEHLAQNYAV